VWNEPLEGLLITTLAALLIANLVDLSDISTMGSAGFLLIFAAVNAANARLAQRTGSLRWLSLLGMALCLAALATLLWQAASEDPRQLWLPVGMLTLAFAIEGGYRLATGRIIRLE
jgi:hypothetical protein